MLSIDFIEVRPGFLIYFSVKLHYHCRARISFYFKRGLMGDVPQNLIVTCLQRLQLSFALILIYLE